VVAVQVHLQVLVQEHQTLQVYQEAQVEEQDTEIQMEQ
jgi:hypothetical protein